MRTLITPIVLVSFVLIPITMATPAAAATINVTDANCSVNGTGTPITGAPGDVVSISTGLTGCRSVLVRKSLVDNDQLRVSVSGTATVTFSGALSTQYMWSVDVGQSITSISITLGSTLATYSQGIIVQGSGGPPPATTWSVTIGSGGGASSTASSPAPQTFELALNPQDGTTCTKSSESGTGGTWITLPSASDCTPPASKPGATLLGWATSPNFSIEIAKRQVANGWGAYETFNAQGQLTGVFIPAGRATFLSASGNIYPIWSK